MWKDSLTLIGDYYLGVDAQTSGADFYCIGKDSDVAILSGDRVVFTGKYGGLSTETNDPYFYTVDIELKK